jgi:ABC-type uncharacterized transport system YnjBCD substrate-binding protein
VAKVERDQAVFVEQWNAGLCLFGGICFCLPTFNSQYPDSFADLDLLFFLNQVDFTSTHDVAGAATNIVDGKYPVGSKAFIWHTVSIGDFNYVAIPKNAANKAAALVLANLILRPDRLRKTTVLIFVDAEASLQASAAKDSRSRFWSWIWGERQCRLTTGSRGPGFGRPIAWRSKRSFI